MSKVIAHSKKEKSIVKEVKTDNTFSWKSMLSQSEFTASPVSCFKHVPFSRVWESTTSGIIVEVKSPDCVTCCSNTPCCFWIAAVIKVSGYMGLLRYEGFDTDDSHDFWVNLCTEPHIHQIGWCAENGMPLVPPKIIEDKHNDWKEYLVRRISRVRTIPSDFLTKLEESKVNTIKNGMQLEVVDKNHIAAVRVATVRSVVGGRVHVKYDDCEDQDSSFWCHERSTLIHPVGWAQMIGHPFKGKAEYLKQSLLKTLYRTYDPLDATWDMFPTVPFNPLRNTKFKEGFKVEAIDPQNPSRIAPATVTEVLRNHFLLVLVDGSPEQDTFCCHASSTQIFPTGFCEANGIEITPPKGYKGEFSWMEYLAKTKSKPAPSFLFQMEVPDHRFREGQHLEAADLLEPRLVCVATVARVVGRLLRIHFDGWEEAFDQWCDCESPDLYPVGWCEAVGCKLERPRQEDVVDAKKTAKPAVTKPKRRKRRAFTQRKRHAEDYGFVVKEEPLDDYPDGTVDDSNSS